MTADGDCSHKNNRCLLLGRKAMMNLVLACQVTSVVFAILWPAILWTVAFQDLISTGFSRQEYWSGFPCSPPGNLPVSGMKHVSFKSPALAGRFFTTSTTWEALKRKMNNTVKTVNAIVL